MIFVLIFLALLFLLFPPVSNKARVIVSELREMSLFRLPSRNHDEVIPGRGSENAFDLEPPVSFIH